MSRGDYRPTRIVSGGQTGVDRGALIGARTMGTEIGGYCTIDRRAEDGEIPSEFPLKECDSVDYLVRTRLNIEHSDATLVMAYEDEARLFGGTARTVDFCRAFDRPYYVLQLDAQADIGSNIAVAKLIRAWGRFLEPATLNVAGPRESKAMGIQAQSSLVLRLMLQTRARCICGRETPAWVWQAADSAAQPVKCSQCGHVTHGSDLE